jgi:hypothetical protein
MIIYSLILISKKNHIFERKKREQKKIKCYTFYPETDMPFVSYIKQQIDKDLKFLYQIGGPFRL